MEKDKVVSALNQLLRGELSAVETYQQALSRIGEDKGAAELRRLLQAHQEAAGVLRSHVEQHGGKPETGSGAWGAFAKAVEGAAKLLGNKAALHALDAGEKHGINDYEKALQELPADCRAVIETRLLPQARSHLPVLDGLLAMQ